MANFWTQSGSASDVHQVFDTWSEPGTQPASEGNHAHHVFDRIPDPRGRVLHVVVHQYQQLVSPELISQVFSAYGIVEEMFHNPNQDSPTDTSSIFIEYAHVRMADAALHGLHGLYLYRDDCQLDIRHANLMELQTFYGYSAPKFSEEQLELLQLIQRDLENLKQIATCGTTKVHMGTDLATTPPSQHNLSGDVCPVLACVPKCMEDQQAEPECKQHEQQLMPAPTKLQFELASLLIPASLSLGEESATEDTNIGIHLATPDLQPRDELACSLSTYPLPLDIDVLVEVDSGLSDIAPVPVPQVVDVTPMTTLADPGVDTPKGAQGLLSTVEIQLTINNEFANSLEPIAAEPQSRLEMFRTLQRTSLSPIFEVVCTSLAEKRLHLVKLDKIQLGLSLELHLWVLTILHNEAVLWPIIQAATRNTILLQPWDPGLPLFGMDNKLGTIKYGLVVRLPTACGVVCLQGHLMHELSSCSSVVQTILNWMAKLMELQPWPSWVLRVMVALVQLQAQFSWKLSVLIMTLARRIWKTAWICCYLHNLLDIEGSTNLAISHWSTHIPSPVIWVLVYCHNARVHFQEDNSVHTYKLSVVRPTDLSLKSTIWAMKLQATKLLCFPRPPAKPPEYSDNCITSWNGIQAFTFVSYPSLLLAKLQQLCQVLFFMIRATSNGRAEVQRHYFCPRILTDADRNRCISHHIRRATTPYSERIEWLLFQSEFGCCAVANIPYFCCVLARWEIPWTVSPVSLKSGFHYCSTRHESVYSCENFQWTIAWSLGDYFSLSSLQTLSSCISSKFGRSGIVTLWELGFWRYSPPRLYQMTWKGSNPFSAAQYGFQVIQWKIAWSLNLQHSFGDSQFAQLSYAKIVKASILPACSLSFTLMHGGCHYLISDKASTLIFQLLAYVAKWSSRGLVSGVARVLHLKFMSWIMELWIISFRPP